MKKLETVANNLLNLWNNGQTSTVLESLQNMSPLEAAITVYYITQNENNSINDLSFIESITAVVTAQNLLTKPNMMVASPALANTSALMDDADNVLAPQISKSVTKGQQSSSKTANVEMPIDYYSGDPVHISRNSAVPNNCRDCAFHSVIPDPDLEDSFNRDDCAVVCTKTPNTRRDQRSEWVAQRQAFEVISGSNRPYEIDMVTPPDWCPLKYSR